MLISIFFLVSTFLSQARAFYSLTQSSHRISTRRQALNPVNNAIDSLIERVSPKPRVQLPANFVRPEPKPLTITRTSDIPSILKSALALGLRLGTGVFVLGWKLEYVQLSFPWDTTTTTSIPHSSSPTQYSLAIGPLRFRDTSSVLDQAPRPAQPLILYEYDASPYCRRVREIFQLLDVPVELRPCPSARQSSFSNDLFKRTGRRTVPYLIDHNTGVEMFESGDQIDYLINTYGPPKDLYDVKALWPITLLDFSIVTSTYAAILRNLPGTSRQANARSDNEKMKPLQLYGYEVSPFVRPVREKLEALCLPHVLIPCSRGSKNRDLLVQNMKPQFQVPFLVDPNTGIEIFDSAEICEYFDAVYTVSYPLK